MNSEDSNSQTHKNQIDASSQLTDSQVPAVSNETVAAIIRDQYRSLMDGIENMRRLEDIYREIERARVNGEIPINTETMSIRETADFLGLQSKHIRILISLGYLYPARGTQNIYRFVVYLFMLTGTGFSCLLEKASRILNG